MLIFFLLFLPVLDFVKLISGPADFRPPSVYLGADCHAKKVFITRQRTSTLLTNCVELFHSKPTNANEQCAHRSFAPIYIFFFFLFQVAKELSRPWEVLYSDSQFVACVKNLQLSLSLKSRT